MNNAIAWSKANVSGGQQKSELCTFLLTNGKVSDEWCIYLMDCFSLNEEENRIYYVFVTASLHARKLFLRQNLWNELSVQHGNYEEKIIFSCFCSAPLCHWCCPRHIPNWMSDEKRLYPDQATYSIFLVWFILNTEEGRKLVIPESILLMSQTELLAKLQSLVTRLLTPCSTEVWKGLSEF